MFLTKKGFIYSCISQHLTRTLELGKAMQPTCVCQIGQQTILHQKENIKQIPSTETSCDMSLWFTQCIFQALAGLSNPGYQLQNWGVTMFWYFATNLEYLGLSSTFKRLGFRWLLSISVQILSKFRNFDSWPR